MKAFGRRSRRDPLEGLPPELQRVLDAAAAPGHPSELVGLPAATAAFMTPSTTERAVSWNLAKLVATPVAAVVAVTGLTGGVALAAATGSLPDAVQDFASNLGAPEADRDESGPATPTATVKLNRGRCVAVTMGNKTTNGKALQTAPLSAAAAGDCSGVTKPGSNRSETATAILEAKPEKSAKPAKSAKPEKAVKPAKSAKPTAKPAAPAARPTDAGKPTAKPAAPAARPTDAGRPAGAGRPSPTATP